MLCVLYEQRVFDSRCPAEWEGLPWHALHFWGLHITDPPLWTLLPGSVRLQGRVLAAKAFQDTFFFSEASKKRSLKWKVYLVHRITSSYNRQGERSARFKGRVTSATVAQQGRILFKEEPAIKNSLGKVLPTRTSALFGAQKPSWCFQDDARLPVPLLGAVNMSCFFWEVAPCYSGRIAGKKTEGEEQDQCAWKSRNQPRRASVQN